MTPIPVTRLLDSAGFLFGMMPEVITGPRRTARIFRARSAVALAARCSGYSYPKIGAALGRNDHKCAMHACDRAEKFYREDAEFKRRCDMLIGMARKFSEAANDNEAGAVANACEAQFSDKAGR